MLASFMAANGIEVTHTSDGNEAPWLASTVAPNIILLSLELKKSSADLRSDARELYGRKRHRSYAHVRRQRGAVACQHRRAEHHPAIAGAEEKQCVSPI